MVSKISLGSANFGLDYGINNKTGKISDNAILNILLFAKKSGVRLIDTAMSYGNAEERIGAASFKNQFDFNIITKLTPSFTDSIKSIVDNSIRNLKVQSIYGLLYHNFKDFINKPESFEELLVLKKRNTVKKIGFSVYFPSEIEYLLERNIDFDIVQFPYSIFDRRFEYLFNELKAQKIEIHTRSIFLQGLTFMNPQSLPSYLIGAKNKLSDLIKISKEFNISISTLCLHFVLKNRSIDNVIIGIDSVNQFEQNILDINKDYSSWNEVYSKLKNLIIDDEKIILPINWK